jgi:hypothetical protein
LLLEALVTAEHWLRLARSQELWAEAVQLRELALLVDSTATQG